MADLSVYEKLADVASKMRMVSSVVWGILPGGTFRFGDQEVRGVKLRCFSNLPAALGDYYKIWFKKYAEREWLLYQGERHTFKQAYQVYTALGEQLLSTYGLQKGDKVGIAMRNYPELLLAFLAITAAGGVAVPLNALWKSEELEYAIADSGAKILIADPERLALATPFFGKLGLQGILVRGKGEAVGFEGIRSWDDVIEAGNGQKAAWPNMHPEDEAMIMYTSGSTGTPKGVVHTHRSVGTAMKIGELAAAANPVANGVKLMAVPLFHITALAPIGLFSIPSGTKIVMMRKWDPAEALNVIEKEQVTGFTGVPTMMRDLMEHPDFDPKRLSSLKGVVAGGAPVPPSQVAKMRAKAKNIESGQGYGLTETMALGTFNKGADYLRHPTSCGKPIPLMCEIAIIDPSNGKALPEGGRGEVCIKGAFLMKGYHNKEEQTREAIDKNGYFHTGDIGKMEGGFLYILDRMKDLIIRGGENIDCSEVEAALNTHPAVRECSVFGLPDERLGEVVGAALWCTQDVSKEEVIAVAAKSLAKFKVPLAINVFVHAEELPKGPTGKLDKKGMRSTYTDLVNARPIKASL